MPYVTSAWRLRDVGTWISQFIYECNIGIGLQTIIMRIGPSTMTFTFLFFLLLFSQVHSFLHPPPKTFLKASSEPRLSRRHHPPFTPSSIPLKCSPLFSVHHTASVVIADLTRAAGIGLIGVLGSYVSQTVIKEEVRSSRRRSVSSLGMRGLQE